MKALKRITPIVFGLALFLPTASFAALQMFLEIDGVVGESQVAGKEGAIEVLAWSWGASNDYVGRKSCSIQDVSITKFADLASPELLMAQVDNQYFQNAKLTVRKSGGASFLDYIVIEFYDVRVTSLSTGGSGGEDRLTENVSLDFSTANYSYTRQNADGTVGETKQASIGGC